MKPEPSVIVARLTFVACIVGILILTAVLWQQCRH